jgi:hypothetical protein
MTDEQPRRLVGTQKSTGALASALDPRIQGEESNSTPEHFGVVPDRPSARPDAFTEHEGPTLASPSSAAIPTDVGLEQRLLRAIARIDQVEADLESLFSRVAQLTDAVNAERLRVRAAHVGRYLLWGAVIAAMATFWMMLRLRAGPH